MMCSILSQVQLDYTLTERREEEVCTASKMFCAKKSKASSLMSAVKRLVSTWKKPDEAAAWYKKPQHGVCHKRVSEVADMVRTHQWLNKATSEQTLRL